MKRERVKFDHCMLEQKRRVQISFQGISTITSTRIIKKCILDYFLYQEFEDNLDTHMPFIRESENRQEDSGLELIKGIRFEKSGIYATRGNPKSLLLKLYKINLCYMVILIICECYNYINYLCD